MTWLFVALLALAAFFSGVEVGYRLARAVLVRFLADSLAALKTAPASQSEPTTYESPAVVPVIRPTRSPFGPTHRRLPLA